LVSTATREIIADGTKARVTLNRESKEKVQKPEQLIDSGLVGGEGFRENRRCSRDTYPESYITEYTLVYTD
jgi:hypothetical protein